ncbi:RNA-binding region-containing protein 3-like isoform X2 [Oscarella lobularis]|uniref:RNA-binding region-containing protein 3-like isoform X2 n=1 Tax=Oscarella lobularis TaxID=121494 RepID=UPI003313F2D4
MAANISSNSTLLVRHLPAALTPDEKEDFLKYFGASRVTVMPSKGGLKHCAFATFDNAAAASKALSRLHQLDVLGSRLVVEHSRKTHDRLVEREEGRQGFVVKCKHEEAKPASSSSLPNVSTTVQREEAEPIAPQFGINYSKPRNLHYAYPPPTVDILLNVMHTMACIPKLYEQVLHLMNKMNLPPPFGPLTIPPPNLGLFPSPAAPVNTVPTEKAKDDMLASDESEMEDEAEAASKESALPKPRAKRIVRLSAELALRQQLQPPAKRPRTSSASNARDVFEIPSTVNKARNLRLVLAATLEAAQSRSNPSSVEQGFGSFAPPLVARVEQTENPEDDLSQIGKITEAELAENRLPADEFSRHSAFKNYSPGEPTARLYVKNLSKKATEKNLKYIFARYVQLDCEEDVFRFDVRLMTEGRMKGQAFVNLPNEEVAKQAVRETNGFLLHERPMCVQFARSAKLKSSKKTAEKI